MAKSEFLLDRETHCCLKLLVTRQSVLGVAVDTYSLLQGTRRCFLLPEEMPGESECDKKGEASSALFYKRILERVGFRAIRLEVEDRHRTGQALKTFTALGSLLHARAVLDCLRQA
jgi:hypothetical protein